MDENSRKFTERANIRVILSIFLSFDCSTLCIMKDSTIIEEMSLQMDRKL